MEPDLGEPQLLDAPVEPLGQVLGVERCPVRIREDGFNESYMGTVVGGQRGSSLGKRGEIAV